MKQVLCKTMLSTLRITPPPLLAARPVRGVKPQHGPSEDVLGLLREERDYTPRELQNPTNTCLQELREYTSMASPESWIKSSCTSN